MQESDDIHTAVIDNYSYSSNSTDYKSSYEDFIIYGSISICALGAIIGLVILIKNKFCSKSKTISVNEETYIYLSGNE